MMSELSPEVARTTYVKAGRSKPMSTNQTKANEHQLRLQVITNSRLYPPLKQDRKRLGKEGEKTTL